MAVFTAVSTRNIIFTVWLVTDLCLAFHEKVVFIQICPVFRRGSSPRGALRQGCKRAGGGGRIANSRTTSNCGQRSRCTLGSSCSGGAVLFIPLFFWVRCCPEISVACRNEELRRSDRTLIVSRFGFGCMFWLFAGVEASFLLVPKAFRFRHYNVSIHSWSQDFVALPPLSPFKEGYKFPHGPLNNSWHRRSRFEISITKDNNRDSSVAEDRLDSFPLKCVGFRFIPVTSHFGASWRTSSRRLPRTTIPVLPRGEATILNWIITNRRLKMICKWSVS